jgi:chaperone modulatory protein CbpM
MISESELIAVTGRVEIRLLHEWIEIGLVAPKRGETGYLFDEVDVARVHLLCDLSFDMGVGHESLPIILSLVDQLHRAHHSLRALAAAIAEQPEAIKSTITLSAQRTLGGRDE